MVSEDSNKYSEKGDLNDVVPQGCYNKAYNVTDQAHSNKPESEGLIAELQPPSTLFQIDKMEIVTPVSKDIDRKIRLGWYQRRFLLSKQPDPLYPVSRIVFDLNRHAFLVTMNPSRVHVAGDSYSIAFGKIQKIIAKYTGYEFNINESEIALVEFFSDIHTNHSYEHYRGIFAALEFPYKSRSFKIITSHYWENGSSTFITYDKAGELRAKNAIYLTGIKPPQNLLRIEFRLGRRSKELKNNNIKKVGDLVVNPETISQLLSRELRSAFDRFVPSLPQRGLTQSSISELFEKLRGSRASLFERALFAFIWTKLPSTAAEELERFFLAIQTHHRKTKMKSVKKLKALLHLATMLKNLEYQNPKELAEELVHKSLPRGFRALNFGDEADIQYVLEQSGRPTWPFTEELD